MKETVYEERGKIKCYTNTHIAINKTTTNTQNSQNTTADNDTHKAVKYRVLITIKEQLNQMKQTRLA